MHLLVIEDSPLDHEMLVAMLAMQGVPAQAERVESADGLRHALAHRDWDLVISDHQLPGFSSGEAFDIVSELDNPPPFIIVSGTIGEDAAVEAMRRGVDDYLIKGRLARLGMAARNAIAAQAARRRLRDSQAQLEDLSSSLQTLIDEERASIAREIHDEIGGTLTAVRLEIEMAQRNAQQTQNARLTRAQSSLARAADATQRIMRNLHPPILDAGLVGALEWEAGQFEARTGVATRFSCNVENIDAPRKVAMAVYRTCQEALTNISKHACASQVSIDLHSAAELVSLEVTDNGKGFGQQDLRKHGSLGLRGLSERARAVGGQVDISCAGRRTTLMLWVPLDHKARPAEPAL